MLTSNEPCPRVVILSLGRLITLLKAGSALEADLTWTTVEYICWVQCEGPISLVSVCLPNMMELRRVLWIRNNPGTNNLITSSVSKQTASDLLSGKRSPRPIDDDREAILMDRFSKLAPGIHVNTTIEARRSASEHSACE